MAQQNETDSRVARRQQGVARAIARRQRGVALVLVLLLSVISLAVGLYAALGSRTEMSLSQNDLLSKQALNVAQAGLNHAAKLVGAHGVFNDELAPNTGGTCTGSGVGTSGSGLAQIGAAKALNGGCYRFRAFGPGATDGYYIVASDNHDETSGADNQLVDIDKRIWITSVGSVATANRTLRGTITLGSGFGFFGITKVTMSGSAATDNFVPPYSPGSAMPTSQVGSNGNISLSGSAKIGGDALAGGTVSTSGGSSVTGARVNGAPPQTYAAVPNCSPHSNNIGIAPASAYNSGTGDLTMSGGGVVTLLPGTYCFDDVTLSGGSTMIISGATTLNVTGKFDSSGGSVSNTTLDADNFSVNSSGGDVKLSGGSQTYMRVYAPSSKVDVSGSSSFFGSIIANELNVSGSGTLHQQSGAGSGGSLLATHEIR